jgi:DNA-binding response OmpR family regulator
MAVPARQHDRQFGKTVGPAFDVSSAIDLIDEDPNVALLDFNLGQETSTPIAERLLRAGIPFVFGSGSDGSTLEGLGSHSILRKPVTQLSLVEALSAAAKGALSRTH